MKQSFYIKGNIVLRFIQRAKNVINERPANFQRRMPGTVLNKLRLQKFIIDACNLFYSANRERLRRLGVRDRRSEKLGSLRAAEGG